MIGRKADKDGHLLLGRMRVCSELEQRQLGLDGVVLLNREAWEVLEPHQRLALCHHELCHMAPAFDSTGVDQQLTGHGDRKWRKVKHDIEEFEAVVAEHGCWIHGLASFAQALLSRSPQLELMVEASGEDSVSAPN